MMGAAMNGASNTRKMVDEIEQAIHTEVGRKLTELFKYARGGLWAAANSVASAQAPRIGLITGFFIPRAEPKAAETDGPIGTAMLAAALSAVGVQCRLATDPSCQGACKAALSSAGLSAVPIDVVQSSDDIKSAVSAWNGYGVTHAISIERCGKSADGAPRNMRGDDIGSYTIPLDDLFIGGSWETIAVGDGGNEIGMGSIPRSLIGANIQNGEKIACATPAKHLVVAGVSNWGAYGLVAAIASLRPQWRDRMLSFLTPEFDRAVLEYTVKHGPAVDGVTAKQEFTVDGLPAAQHHEMILKIRSIVDA